MDSVLVVHPVAFRQPHRKKNVLLKYAVSKPVKVSVARIEKLRKPDCITRDSCMRRAHWSFVDTARWSVQKRIVVEELFIDTNWMAEMGIVFPQQFC
jgi:hypothetical protein